MSYSIEQSSEKEPSSDTSPPFRYLLLVWFLIGSSLWPVGAALAEVLPVGIPLSSMGIGLLFGTVVVTVPWAFGFYPSLPASLGYFITELTIKLSVFLLVVPLYLSEFTPEIEIVIRILSIAPAAILVFTDAGRYLRTRLRQYFQSVLKLPPEEYPSHRD